MATQDTTDRQTLDALLAGRRVMAWGLLWAAALLVLLAFWLGARELEPGLLFCGLVFLLGVAAFAGFLWQIWPPLPDAAAVRKQRRQLALGLFAAAGLLLLLAVLVALQLGLSGFGEVSSMVVMALIGAGAGVNQFMTSGSRWDAEQVLGRVLGNVLLGIVPVGAALGWFAFRSIRRGQISVQPEIIALLLFGLICLVVTLLPRADAAGKSPEQGRRYLILSVGGSFGLLVALFTAYRVWLSWGEIFPPNVPMAQSEGIWRLWLCLYVELFGLALLFGSLTLASPEVRRSATVRRVLYGYNAVMTGFLLLVILVVVNIVFYVAYPLSLTWSQEGGLRGLSTSTTNLLQSLKEPVHVYVLMSPAGRTYLELHDLLENGESYTRQLQVEYVSPDRQAGRYRTLAEKFPVILREERMLGGDEDEIGRGVLLVYGPESAKTPPHAFIPVRDLIESKPPDPHNPRKRTYVFKGEDVILTQLRILVEQQTKPMVYFTQGHGELDMTDALDPRFIADDPRGGSGKLMERLKKDNYEVKGLVWHEAPPQPKGARGPDLMVYSKKSAKEPHEVPADAKVVIVAGPYKPFSKEVADALDRFMKRPGDKAGKLIVLSNYVIGPGAPLADLGQLADVLRQYNVQVDKDFLLRVPDDQRTETPYEVIAQPPPNIRNKVAANFLGKRFPVGGSLSLARRGGIGLARSVKPVASPGTFQVDTLLQVGPMNGTYWAETDVNVLRGVLQYLANLEDTGRLDSKKSKEPIPVVVAVSDRDGKPRMVVFGDARFASNRFVNTTAPYYDFLTSSIEWLAERPGNIGIRPRESTSFALQPENVNKARLLWLPLALILLAIVGMGLGVWVVRRR